MDSFSHLMVVVLFAIVGAIVGALLMWVRNRLALGDAVSAATRRSLQRSRSTIKGQIAEQMVPMLKGFPYHPAEARFLGDPVDYVVFNGYTGVKDDSRDDELLEIVIVDVKQGTSRLSASQRAIARAIAAGRVRFEVLRVDDDGRVKRQLARV